MDRLELVEWRVQWALAHYQLAAGRREYGPPGYVELDTRGWEERARMALRHAVIMMEANCAD